jgi:hypothetical protein
MAAYKNILIFVLGFLALATNVFAGRLTYAVTYNQGMKGQPQTTTRAVKKAIPDDHIASIKANIGTWSKGLYGAKQNDKTGILLVSPVKNVDTAAQARNTMEDMMKLVCDKLKECPAKSDVTESP